MAALFKARKGEFLQRKTVFNERHYVSVGDSVSMNCVSCTGNAHRALANLVSIACYVTS